MKKPVWYKFFKIIFKEFSSNDLSLLDSCEKTIIDSSEILSLPSIKTSLKFSENVGWNSNSHIINIFNINFNTCNLYTFLKINGVNF